MAMPFENRPRRIRATSIFNMKKSKSLLIAALGFALAVLPLSAQDAGEKNPGVTKGPATAKLGAIALIEVPVGYAFLDGKTTRAMLKAAGEPTSGSELGFMRPTNAHWSVFFEFSDVGYIKDDDKDKLDAAKMLQSIIKGNDAGNEARKRAGNPPLVIVGWEQEPKYNAETHNLEWAIRATSEGRPILNYNTRLLGRKGVMEVVLVCEPDELAATLSPFKSLLAGHKFSTGETYAEYRPGDKVAKYGLAALVVGGAAVGAAKLGLLGWLLPFLKKGWILIVAAFAAVANFFKKTFAKITGRKRDE